MARYPAAEWRPLPENRTEPKIKPRGIIFHSIVGSAEGAYGHFLNSTDLESHFIVRKNGKAIQLIDTDRDADAQPVDHYISVETEDNGDPDRDPWTPAQLATLVDIARWAARTHGFPLRRCRDPYDSGVGYHSMWGAPSPWTPVAGKTCPGRVRIEQFNRVIMPALEQGTDVMEVYMFCKHGDDSEVVLHWQIKLRDLGYYGGELDGKYGNQTAAAVLAARKAAGSSVDSGKSITAYAKRQIDLLWTVWASEQGARFGRLEDRSDRQNKRIQALERMHYDEDVPERTEHPAVPHNHADGGTKIELSEGAKLRVEGAMSGTATVVGG